MAVGSWVLGAGQTGTTLELGCFLQVDQGILPSAVVAVYFGRRLACLPQKLLGHIGEMEVRVCSQRWAGLAGASTCAASMLGPGGLARRGDEAHRDSLVSSLLGLYKGGSSPRGNSRALFSMVRVLPLPLASRCSGTPWMPSNPNGPRTLLF